MWAWLNWLLLMDLFVWVRRIIGGVVCGVMSHGDYDGDRGEGLKGCGNEGTVVLFCGFGMAN
jgi:hypothetical protein